MSEPMNLKLDLNRKNFQAGPRTYYIQNELNVIRFKEYQKISLEISFNTTFEGLYETMNKIYEAASSGNDLIKANHIVRELAFNQINAIVDFVHRDHHSILRFCCLFINYEGEDLTQWNDALVDRKIKDWEDAGIVIDDFFFLAANFIPTFRAVFRHLQEVRGVDVNKKPPDQPTDSILKEMQQPKSPGT